LKRLDVRLKRVYVGMKSCNTKFEVKLKSFDVGMKRLDVILKSFDFDV
tara:strand:+ start:10913 stop:11056 length:144 start_codon:yes stop_codon:yes gene_type:complete